MNVRKTFALAAVVTSVALGSFAAPATRSTKVPDEVFRKMTLCSAPVKISREPLKQALPAGLRAEVIRLESDSYYCANQYVAIVAPSGRFYVGGPWFLDGLKGTREEKIKAFAWSQMKQSYSATVDSRISDGLNHVVLSQRTDYGVIKTEGWIDQAGTIFIPGDFNAPGADLTSLRLTRMNRVLEHSPTRGPSMARVSLVEFSDFQCPSCRASAAYMKPVLQKYKDRIRYVRVDMPLISHHPWAFPAAIAGRAIYRQNPDAFWKFKDWVYENQSELTLFTLDDFAMNFVKDHSLDVGRYKTDVSSPEVRNQLLNSVGTASAIGISGTPSFMVNGVMLDPGADGKAIDQYLAAQLQGKK